jgi:protocatechuate 3,4-dioxygenase beta subunit
MKRLDPDLGRRSLLRWAALGPLAAWACDPNGRVPSRSPTFGPVLTAPAPGSIDRAVVPPPGPIGGAAGSAPTAAQLGSAEAPQAASYPPDGYMTAGERQSYGARVPRAEGDCRPTAEDVLGPFHREGAPARTALAAPSEPGERLAVRGRVLGPDCKTPLAGARVDVWHADAGGNYDMSARDYKLRGVLTASAAGAYAFESILPGRYRLGSSFRPRHVHFKVTAEGFRPLVTQLYFRGDPYLAPNDPCDVCGSGDATLIMPSAQSERGVHAVTFDIVLVRA